MSQAAKARFIRLMDLVRTNNPEADKALAAALRVTPKDPNILQLAAHRAEETGDPARAVALYRRALLTHAGWLEVGFNLARLLGLSRIKKEREEAIGLLESLTRFHPQNPDLWEALARFCQKENRLSEAVAFWQKALALRPENGDGRGQSLFARRQLCIWDEEPAPSPSFSPNITALLFDDPALQKQAAEAFSAKRFAGISPLPPAPTYAHARLKIGYLSSDFHAHATAWLMAELFELHDRSRFEVFVYSYGRDDGSDIRARIKRGAEHFTDLAALTPTACAEKIRADEIDLLVDLKGHTTGGRLDILARRPAPLQLHWLGFPATLGAPFIDAFVADFVTVPEGAEKHFTEEIWRLPDSYQINDRKKKVAPAKSRKAYGLAEDGLVLACFNQSYKITSQLFDIWCEILRKESSATLWLYETNPAACANLRATAKGRGIDPERLIFAPPLPLDEHLARYAHADLALDTSPVGGHTTTSDALWCGVPVVTMAGASFISRVAASLLTAAGVPELITASPEAYKALCLTLMRDPEKLAVLKSRLCANRTSLPLFDTPRFVREWENLLKAKTAR
jgi:predicted O-linked N-acetylglucosamine transferase (SPINDLY family)